MNTLNNRRGELAVVEKTLPSPSKTLNTEAGTAMSILVNKNTKIITQGMTGKTGTFHTEQASAR